MKRLDGGSIRVELRAEARNDLVSAAIFYARQSPGLDDYFLDCRQDPAKTDARIDRAGKL